jgi:hypothetical protein
MPRRSKLYYTRLRNLKKYPAAKVEDSDPAHNQGNPDSEDTSLVVVNGDGDSISGGGNGQSTKVTEDEEADRQTLGDTHEGVPPKRPGAE